MDGLENKEPLEKGENDKLRDELVKLYARLFPDSLKTHSGPVKVISVGCGHFVQEVPAVYTHIHDPRYTGIDKFLPPETLKTMMEDGKYPNFQLIEADATDPANIGNSEWDLAILRNPQIGFSTKASTINPIWERIITNTLNGIKPGGYLLLSGSTEDEFERTARFVVATNSMRVLAQENPIKPPIASKFPMVEKGIALLQKVV